MDNNLIALIDDNGNETLMEIVGTFYLEEYDKDYVCVIPNETTDDSEETDIYIFSYVEEADGTEGKLSEIESEEEWAACEKSLNEYLEAEFDDEIDIES